MGAIISARLPGPALNEMTLGAELDRMQKLNAEGVIITFVLAMMSFF